MMVIFYLLIQNTQEYNPLFSFFPFRFLSGMLPKKYYVFEELVTECVNRLLDHAKPVSWESNKGKQLHRFVELIKRDIKSCWDWQI